MKPARSIYGRTYRLILAPPIIATSTLFIANSIASIDNNDIPQAVWNAFLKDIFRERSQVSSAIEVTRPLTIAIDSIVNIGH